MSEPVIVLDVRKRFGHARVLAGVSFTVEPATITHLTAANGAGKTTLLRVIAGLTHPDAGIIGALLLVPAGAWLTLAAVNSEDPGQSAVTNVNGRGVLRVRLFVLLAAFIACCGLTAISVGASIVSDTEFGIRQDRPSVIGLLIVAHLIDAVLGVAMTFALRRRS